MDFGSLTGKLPVGALLGAAGPGSWFPAGASAQAGELDGTWYGIYVAAVFAVLTVAGLAVVFIRLFGRGPGRTRGEITGRPNRVLQAAFVLTAVLLAGFAFRAGVPGFVDQTVAPLGATAVRVDASQWAFQFTYANGHVADTLHVARNVPVALTLQSSDAVHSLSVPALRLNPAILPGRPTSAWFTATVADTFPLLSSIYSGEGFDTMRTALVVHTSADFDAWLARVMDIFTGRTMVEAGELLYNTKGCKACHTLDGSRLVGPSFKDVYGFQFATREGATITADDAYIRESILTPNASVIAGFEPVMTPYAGRITDREIEAVTAWLRTLSSRGGTAEAAADSAATQQEGN